MAQYFVIDQIEIDHDGPVANGPRIFRKKIKKQLIHLSQGSIDGACGPYCIMMALLICGLIDRDDLVCLRSIDGRTNPGKLVNLLQEYQGLFRNGTNTVDLKKMLIASYSKKLVVFDPEDDGLESDIRKFVKKHLDNNHPVILWLKYPKSKGHWVVAIGYEYMEPLTSKLNTKDNDDESALRASRKPLRFLLLDPDDDGPTISAWNGVVDAVGTKGSYPFIWWGDNNKVKFHSALALSPKK